jgi:nucleoside-diphosphate-sugar epimerase
LAALSNDPLGDLCAELTYDINHRASVRLATYAKQCGVGRFVFSSSCSLYGAAGDAPVTETADFNPVTPYAESKVFAERDISQLADAEFTPIFMRNATAYGVSPRLRVDLVVNSLVGSAVTSGQVLLRSDGSAWRPLVHVEDISRAVLAVLRAPRESVHNEAFNVGTTEENYRIRDVAEIVSKTASDCPVAFASGASADARCYRVDFAKLAKRVTAFEPAWTVEKGAKQLNESFRRARITASEFGGPKYQRVTRINELLSAGILDSELRFVSDRTSAGAQ